MSPHSVPTAKIHTLGAPRSEWPVPLGKTEKASQRSYHLKQALVEEDTEGIEGKRGLIQSRYL